MAVDMCITTVQPTISLIVSFASFQGDSVSPPPSVLSLFDLCRLSTWPTACALPPSELQCSTKLFNPRIVLSTTTHPVMVYVQILISLELVSRRRPVVKYLNLTIHTFILGVRLAFYLQAAMNAILIVVSPDDAAAGAWGSTVVGVFPGATAHELSNLTTRRRSLRRHRSFRPLYKSSRGTLPSIMLFSSSISPHSPP